MTPRGTRSFPSPGDNAKRRLIDRVTSKRTPGTQSKRKRTGGHGVRRALFVTYRGGATAHSAAGGFLDGSDGTRENSSPGTLRPASRSDLQLDARQRRGGRAGRA